MFLAKHTYVDVVSQGEGIMETLVDFNEGQKTRGFQKVEAVGHMSMTYESLGEVAGESIIAH